MALYGILCTGLGRLPSEIGEMTLAEACRLLEYWQEAPPVHVLVRAALGVQTSGAARSSASGNATKRDSAPFKQSTAEEARAFCDLANKAIKGGA